MNIHSKTNRILTSAVLATAFAGSALNTVGSALGVRLALPLWLTAALAAAVCGLMSISAPSAIAGLVLLGIAGAGWAMPHADALRAIPGLIAAWQGGQVDPAVVPDATQALLIGLALLFGMIFYLLIYHQGFTGLAVMLLGAALMFSHGMSAQASVLAAVPGLAAAAAAFALSGGIQRDAPSQRVLALPALAAVLALMALPAGRVAWPPMERLADRVRDVFEQYFNFTHERIAFSISEEGYNHGGEINGQPVAMLGGPANPDPSPVMRVASDGPLLLRGAIRATYTGYSWVDVVPKNRYLYYDLTHRAVRDRVFDLNFKADEAAFRAVSGDIELLDSATSTLFVPGRLSGFDMDLSNAVYYNSSGEMFMAREAQPGDRYAVAALSPVFGDALRQAALWAEHEADNQYADILAAHSQLPDGVERGLYALTGEITAGAESAYDRATAIADYLRRSMRYRLDVDYPPRGRDFASYFVLDAHEGYCSYFATAMAVMGRIAGLPTRYVEGYLARPGSDGVATLTGMDAHAWAEVYFNGLGWIPFDATNGGPNAGAGAGGDGAQGSETYGDPSGASEDDPDGDGDRDAAEAPEDDPAKPLDGDGDRDASAPPDGDDNDHDDDRGDAPPEADEPPDDALPPDDASDDPTDPSDAPPSPRNLPWPLLPLLLLALASVWIVRRLRAADPIRLCADARRAQQGAMIAFRANLTLLSHMGQQPQNGETPDAFAQRVAKELDNPDYAEFVQAVSHSRYGARPLRRDNVECGLRAYRRFNKRLRPAERLRYALARILHGLGDFENIP